MSPFVYVSYKVLNIVTYTIFRLVDCGYENW